MSDRSMWDLEEWRPVPCVERDALLGHADLVPGSSLTDIDGEFGVSLIYTEWWRREHDSAVIRDYKWPNSTRPCEHWVPIGGDEQR